MGNTQGTHAMARIGKLGSAMQEVTIEKEENERLGLNMKSLVVTSIDDPSAAHRHGCGANIGMRLVSVNGHFVGSAAEVREKSRGQTVLTLRFIPKELPVTLEKRGFTESLGLTFNDNSVLMSVAENSPGKRGNADNYLGLKVVSVNGIAIAHHDEIDAASEGDRLVTLGFSVPLPDPNVPQAALARRPSNLADSVNSTDPNPPSERQLRCRHLANTEASELIVSSPNKWQHCSGKYVVLQGELANGWPVWERVSTELFRWLYSTPHGYWRVTDSKADFPRGGGYIITKERHGGRLPHEMMMWQTKYNIDDSDIMVKLELNKEEYHGDVQAEQGMRVRVMKGEHTGKGGIVTFVGQGGVEIHTDANDHITVSSAVCLAEEGKDECVLWKASEAGIGMRFDGAPTDLTLRGVVEDSPADIFDVQRFVGRSLISACDRDVNSYADVQDSVSGVKLVVLKFAPSVQVEHAALLKLILEAEDAGRLAVSKLSDACHLLNLQHALTLSAHHSNHYHTSLMELRMQMKGIAEQAVEQGKGVSGTIESLQPYQQRQDDLVRCIQAAVKAGEYPLAGGAMLMSPTKEQYAAIMQDVVELTEANDKAEQQAALFRKIQDGLDQADDERHRTQRELTRKPSDVHLKARLEDEDREILSKRQQLETVVCTMRSLAPTAPFLYAYILPYEAEKERQAMTSSISSSPNVLAGYHDPHATYEGEEEETA
eukprot:TRINITY_DN9179_c3_g1_i1.p1 TRINITY_DN9179_c3_g1~~TRINITY_DN9179_c3_g1_i1.p1  ORF type:complete len:715 (+),score=165.51 TRINITY_DN9179_c3_g1_i1:113-2257(+)